MSGGSKVGACPFRWRPRNLEKLGVSLDHRKRLMRAIAELGDAPAAARPPTAELKAAAGESGERRPTVLFWGRPSRS
jgi:hypothetical protein